MKRIDVLFGNYQRNIANFGANFNSNRQVERINQYWNKVNSLYVQEFASWSNFEPVCMFEMPYESDGPSIEVVRVPDLVTILGLNAREEFRDIFSYSPEEERFKFAHSRSRQMFADLIGKPVNHGIFTIAEKSRRREPEVIWTEVYLPYQEKFQVITN